MSKTVYKLQDRKSGKYYGRSNDWTSMGRTFGKAALKLAIPHIRNVDGRVIDIIEYVLTENRRIDIADVNTI